MRFRTKTMRWMTAAVVIIGMSSQVGALVSDPNELDSMINSAGRVLQQEAGNYTVAAFNVNPNRLVFTMEEADKYPPGGQGLQLDQIKLTTAGGSPIDLTVTLDAAVTFGRVLDNASDKATSGVGALAYKADVSKQAVIRFDQGVSGVGICLMRLVDDFTVTLYDGSDAIIDTYVVASQGGLGYSFFGYYDADSHVIRKMEIAQGDGQEANLFWLDDLAVIQEPPVCPEADDINSNCREISEEIGNYTVADFNDSSQRVLFNFDDIGGPYPPAGYQIASVTDGVVVVTLDAVSPYGRIRDNNVDHASSGTYALAYNTRNNHEAVFHTSNAVFGIGLVLNRLVADITISVYDSSDVLLDSFVVARNDNQTNFSFFGYYNGLSATVKKIVLDTTAVSGNQFWIDDLVVIHSPPQCVGELAGDLTGDCYVNMIDLSLLAGNWLECYPGYAGCP